jgi:hypothetical protein
MNNEIKLREAVRQALNALNQIRNTKLNGANGHRDSYAVCSYLDKILKETEQNDEHVIETRLFDSSDESKDPKYIDIKIIVQGVWIWIEAPVKGAEDINEKTPIGIEYHDGKLRNLSYMPNDEEPIIHEWEI